MTPIQTAAQQVIEQWDAPLWKNTISTAHFIGELRKALEAEQAQAVGPVATVQCVRGVTIGYLDVMQPVGTKLYLHPAPPPAEAQQVAVPMTEAQIFECDPVPHVMFDQQRIDFARAIEAHHCITGAKP